MICISVISDIGVGLSVIAMSTIPLLLDAGQACRNGFVLLFSGHRIGPRVGPQRGTIHDPKRVGAVFSFFLEPESLSRSRNGTVLFGARI